uniref:Uncharacterized protein n=1 Tax=Oryza brachyantha TaxID=4533 RepID=J3LK56_ORYBR
LSPSQPNTSLSNIDHTQCLPPTLFMYKHNHLYENKLINPHVTAGNKYGSSGK